MTDYVPQKHDLEVIVLLLDLAAIYLTPSDGSVFTFDELFKEAHDLGGPEFDLSERDVRIVLPFMKSLKRLPGQQLCLR